MTREVVGEQFFHINRQMPYSLHPPLTVGQKLTVGAEENPFFRFFSTHVRRFPVTQDDGKTVEVSAIAFLRLVRDGHITPGNLPGDAFDIGRHFMLLARELLWESVRLAEFPNAPSRQRSLWLLSDVQEVSNWIPRLDDPNQRRLQVVEFDVTGQAHECDSSLLLGDSESLYDSYNKARQYWAGEMLPQGSAPEVLFEGRLAVVQILEPGSI